MQNKQGGVTVRVVLFDVEDLESGQTTEEYVAVIEGSDLTDDMPTGESAEDKTAGTPSDKGYIHLNHFQNWTLDAMIVGYDDAIETLSGLAGKKLWWLGDFTESGRVLPDGLLANMARIIRLIWSLITTSKLEQPVVVASKSLLYATMARTAVKMSGGKVQIKVCDTRAEAIEFIRELASK
jgi:hypothetical protein